MRKLRAEMHRRMLGNGYCARPVGLDCHFESICESCTYFQTTHEFRPTLQRQRDDAAEKGQVGRQKIFDGLLAGWSTGLLTALMTEPVLFEVATNPDPDSTLPFLIRLPLATGELVLKARDSWPRTAKVYCHRADRWPEEPQIIERVPIRSCQRRGVAIDLVLDRPRENRSQLIFTRIQGGREGIFWQTARTTRQARPGIRVPRRLAAGLTELTTSSTTASATHTSSPNNIHDRRQAAPRRRPRLFDASTTRSSPVDELIPKILANFDAPLERAQLAHAIIDLATTQAPRR